jgi:hypothetical protein
MFKKLIYSVSILLVLSVVSINPAFGVVVWEGQITGGSDSVEEAQDGSVNMGSSDLELPTESSLQAIGLRFVNVGVPKGATITNAYIEFAVDETSGPEVVNLIIDGELVPDAQTFQNVDGNVRGRARTAAQVEWHPEAWPATGARHQTSDISAVITEVVGQDGWVLGNALAIIIVDDPADPSKGNRVAESNTSTLLHIEFTTKFAFGPVPADGSYHSDTWAGLVWTSGDIAVSHDIYFGDNFADVNDGAGDTFRANQSLADYIVGFAGFPFPDGLIPGTTYYWRIDEVEADGATKHKGSVWSFMIPPKTAYGPDPADGAEFVDPNAEFSWTPGFGAKLHNFYIGTNFDDVSNAAGAMPLGNADYSPGTLESEKVYYWRVDEFDPPFTYKGDVWSFTTPGAVGNAQPANGATDVQMTATLSWTAADNAASHELYFGADAEAVNNATTASPEYIGPKVLGAESYDPGGLAWDSSYAWRVDEVYPTETVKGLVWSFATADFISVDDFESYNDIDPPDAASNRIFDKWIDGFGTTTNGALVGNDMPPYAEQTIVHGGAQSLVYAYDNNLKTSEATLTLVYPRDWTEEGVTKLSLRFRGASANAAERMFVALGNAVVYHDDASATQMTGWNEWVIDLATFGVGLTNVNSITIGFGTNPGAPGAAGGTGQMYFDDIRLIR